MNDKIDIVIPWVDGNDPNWKKEKEEYSKKELPDLGYNSYIRYETWDNLKYWFRAVEKFIPWVNNIFFITWGHIPDFLDLTNPKLKIVKHTDYIPKEYLPTFNAGVIEMNVHRIDKLSENYIMFNDDCFPLSFLDETYYFKNNVVCDEAIESPIIPKYKDDCYKWFCSMQVNNISVINKYFNKREVIKKNFWKWFYPGYGELLKRNCGLNYWNNFVGFRDPHLPSALKKSTLSKLWEIERDVLDSSSRNKFRNEKTDVNQYLIRYFNLCSGEFSPRKAKGKYYDVSINNYKEIANIIRNQRQKVICINENCTEDEFKIIKAEINKAFSKILPEKSSFEK